MAYPTDYKRLIFARRVWYRNPELVVLVACVLGIFVTLALTWARAEPERPCKALIWVGKIGTESRGILRQDAGGTYVCEVKRERS